MSDTVMRAKMVLEYVKRQEGGEELSFRAVPKNSSYPENGLDEDNTFAKFSPSATCTIYVANPALFGKLDPGKKYYVDFTEAPTD